MIKVKGLQIGNLFRDKLTGKLLSVCGLDEEKELIEFKVINRENYPLPDGWQAEPVELMPEVLQACGFENTHPKRWYLCWESYELQYSEYNNELGILPPDGCTSGHTVYFPCGHLHQLQNLYALLTGEELKVKL